jgi:hypothetical protein
VEPERREFSATRRSLGKGSSGLRTGT